MRAMKTLLILSALLWLTACSTARTVHLPDGWLAHEVNCNWPPSFGSCLERAGEICPKGFDRVDAQGRPLPIGTNTISKPGNLLVKCH